MPCDRRGALALSAAEAAEHGARGRADRVGREHTEGSNEPRRKRKLDEGSSGGPSEQRGFQQRTDTSSTRRGKGSSHVRKGKALFIDEEYASETYGRGVAREPHLVEDTGFEPPPGVAARGIRWATVRSLADESVVRVLPAHRMVGLAQYFARRVDPEENDHQLCTAASCARCQALFEAVRIDCRQSTPPMAFAMKWRRLAPKVAAPAL